MTFEKIKVGDPVWIEWSRSRGKSIRQLSTVKKLTRTQIVTSHLGKKFYREDGREIAGSAYLGGIASPEELAEWNRQQEELANARRLRAAQEAERESKRRELNTLFLSPAANVRADIAQFSVEIDGLREDQVRQIAELVNQFEKK